MQEVEKVVYGQTMNEKYELKKTRGTMHHMLSCCVVILQQFKVVTQRTFDFIMVFSDLVPHVKLALQNGE